MLIYSECSKKERSRIAPGSSVINELSAGRISVAELVDFLASLEVIVSDASQTV